MRCDKITTIFSRVTEVKCENIFIWSKNIKRIISLLKEYEKNFYKENIEYFASLFEPIEECSKYVKLLKEEGF